MKKFISLLTILSLTSCSLFTVVSNREITKSENTWRTAHINSYRYTFNIGSLSRQRDCVTPRIGIEVEVTNGVTTKFGTCDPTSVLAKRYGNIEAIFNDLRSMKADSPVELEVHFNNTYGYPEKIDVNYSRFMTDHRYQYYVTDLVIVGSDKN